MIQSRFQVLCYAIVLCAASRSHLEAQEPRTPGKPPVEIFLTASGKNSVPVLVEQAELTVTLDKQPAQVTSLRSAKDDKLLFAVMIDVSTSNRAQADSIKEAANQLFQGLSTGSHRGYLVAFDVSARISNRPLEPSEAPKALDGLQFGGATALFDAIAQTSTTVLSKSRNPDIARRVIILLSDGDDNQSRTHPQDAEEKAERDGVSIFSLDTTFAHNRGEDMLKELATKTGGQAITDWKMEEGVKTLLEAINFQSVLTFVPTPASNHDLHSHSVKSLRKDIQISAPAQVALP